MKIQPKRVLDARQGKSWTQDELAVASGLNMRTIQRIEKDGVASLQSVKALAAALDLNFEDLGTKENPMKSCPECGSTDQVYRYDGEVTMYGMNGDLLPGLGVLHSSRACPVVCAACGYLRFFVAAGSLERLKRSKKWKLVG